MSRPAGSPAAQRFDPPVRATRWLVLVARPWSAFVEEVRARAQLDADGLERVLRHGGIWLDKKPAPEPPPREVRAGAHAEVYAFANEPEPVALSENAVLCDEAGVVAVDKPAWLTVQRTRASRVHSLERMLGERLDCPGIAAAHRLDRQTSGVILFARDSTRAGFLGRELASRRVEKTYLAVTARAPDKDEWTVRAPIAPARMPPRYRFELRAAPDPDTQDSETRFRVLAREPGRALVACSPTTGRTHQIRVHLAASGAPVAGDDLYGEPWHPGEPERVLLHAYELRLRFAAHEPARVLRAPVPADFPPSLAADIVQP